jgi:uncharacterized protein (DUF362 family)
VAEKITRRSFLKQGAVVVGGVLSGMALVPSGAEAGAEPELFVVHGAKYYENTLRAVDGLGGMGRIVSRGSRVGLLVNHAFLNIGAHVHPDMTVAVARMCFDAGAGEVTLIKSPTWGYYRRARSDRQAEDVIRQIKGPSGDYRTVAIKGALALEKADIMKDLLECDVFINVAIVKSHAATFITASLKNMMGSAPFSTCSHFHLGGLFEGDRNHLAQCIADINLVRKPDLCVMDATEVLARGVPHGPGPLKRPRKIFVGRDPVAVDTYGARLLGVNPKTIRMLDFAAGHGLGRKDLSKVKIREIEA